MWSYIIYYDVVLLRDSSDFGLTFETEEEAIKNAEDMKNEYMLYGYLEGAEYNPTLFDIDIMEV